MFAGQLSQTGQVLAMVDVLMAHHGNRLPDHRVATRLDHGKEHALFLGHVFTQFLVHALKVVGQTGGHLWVVAVHSLDAAGHADQFRHLGAVHLVIARDDVIDQRARLRGDRGRIVAHQGLEGGFVLGPLLEENLRRALAISRGDPAVLLSSPITWIFAVLIVFVIGLTVRREYRKFKT